MGSLLGRKKSRRNQTSEEPSLDEPQVEDAGVANTDAQEETSSSLASRLKKSRESFFGKIKSVFTGKVSVDEEALDDLEEILVTSDLGVKLAGELVEEVRSEIESGREFSEEELIDFLESMIIDELRDSSGESHGFALEPAEGGPLVVMVVGVNGVGKTTTVAKLANSWAEDGKKVLMVAADTFRAAAVEQLRTWGGELDIPVVYGPPECKPSTVVYDGMEKGNQEGFDIILIDTAGRLHTKSNLMQELEGVRNVISKQQANAPHETLLVLDGSTGQNALSQAREFDAAVDLTGLIVTKLDGTPKGGIVVAVKKELDLPIRYIGVGEAKDDLRPFNSDQFVQALLAR